jgi:hypothetical protein
MDLSMAIYVEKIDRCGIVPMRDMFYSPMFHQLAPVIRTLLEALEAQKTCDFEV